MGLEAKAEAAAENAYLKLGGRIMMVLAGPVFLLGISTLDKINTKLDGMNTSINLNASNIASSNVRTDGIDHRVDRLETWHDQFIDRKGNTKLMAPLLNMPEWVLDDTNHISQANP